MKTFVPIALTLASCIASAEVIDLAFDVRLDRIYSYDGRSLAGITVGDVTTLRIEFDNTVVQTWTEQNPWGEGTARLYSRLQNPVIVNSPFEQFVPTSPFQNQPIQNFGASGVTSNERQNGPYASVWYEDLWFNKQYDQVVEAGPDGSYAYRYKFNVHWNKTNNNYTPGSLYFFTPITIKSLLDTSIRDGITFNLSQDAYIQKSDGSASGFNLNGTATLREYRVLAVPEPNTQALLAFGISFLLCNSLLKFRKAET